MNEAIGQLLPFAVGVGLSPIPIIAVVLMLATPRARVNGPAFLPGWLATVDHFGPGKALGFGALLSGANPKNLLLTIGAAAAVAQTGIAAGQETIALAVFIVVGSIGVGGPIVIYFVLGERSQKLLDGLKSWMAANNTVIMAVLILVIGAKLVGDGISGL
jgi:hypothetical protein